MKTREILAAYGIFIGFVCVIFAAIGAALWPYTINSWLAFFDKPEAVVWWQGAILGFVPVVGQVTIPAAVITWVLMLILI